MFEKNDRDEIDDLKRKINNVNDELNVLKYVVNGLFYSSFISFVILITK